MKAKIVLFILTLMILVQAAAASDIGVGVSPGNLSYRLAPGTSAEQSIYVINTGNETATYNVFLDDNAYDSWFTFSISSFELRAGENREVKVKLYVPASTEGNVDCKIKVPCTVPGGDIGTGVIIPVHIEVSTSEGSSSGISSSGGSSSAGGVSPEPASNIESKELSQQYVTNGSRAEFDFTQNATCVTYVMFDARKSMGKVTTVVEMLKEKSQLTPDIPEGEIYSYLNIWAGNDGAAATENIENAVIGFKVNKTWVSENRIDIDSITLGCYEGDRWNSLHTKKTAEDGEYIYLEAETLCFSYFVITGENTDEAGGKLDMTPITRVSGKFKETAESLETTAVKNFEEKSPEVLAKIEGYEETVREFCLKWIHFVMDKDWYSYAYNKIM